jgi:hypothetical protein
MTKSNEMVTVGSWTLVRQPSYRKYKWKAVSPSGHYFGYGDTKKKAIQDARKAMR